MRQGFVKSSQKLVSWASWMASISMVMITSAWLLAELSSSPLINSLLIGAQNLPAFLPISRSIKGIGLFLAATTLLELIVVCLYFQLLPNWLLITFTLAVALMASSGSIISLLPMTDIILDGGRITNQSLQQSSDIGGLSGTLLGGIVYPYFKLFPPAILLVLAPAWLSQRKVKTTIQAATKDLPVMPAVPPLDRWCLLQGLCTGALFALLPLWILSIKDGTSIDFSFVLGAFMLGRVLESRLLPKLSAVVLYFCCAVLILIAFYPNVPIWLDVIVFIPLGAAITRIEFDLIDHLDMHGELPLRRDILFRSLAVASVIGSLSMGVIGQSIGVGISMLLVGIFFGLAALITWRWRRPPTTHSASN